MRVGIDPAEEVAETDLLRRVLTSGPFPGISSGHPDVYKAFCWRFWNLVRPGGGLIGVVLPRAVFAAKGSEPFRRTIIESGRINEITQLLNNKGWVFEDVDPRYSMVLVSVVKEKPRADETLQVRGPYASKERFDAGIAKEPLRFAARDVLSWTDTAALPLLSTEKSGEVFLQLRMAPRLGLNKPRLWRARPYQELNATNDKFLMKFTDDPPGGYWPVFKGESFDIWEPDRKIYYAWADPEKVMEALQKKRLNSARLARSGFSVFPPACSKDP